MANHQRSVEKEAVWRGHLTGQASSGQSIRAYCREHQLSEPSFYVWRREIARRDREQESTASHSRAANAASTSTATDIAGLVAVDVVGQITRPLTMEVALTTGVVIRLREDVSAETLSRVLAATGARECATDSDRGAAC